MISTETRNGIDGSNHHKFIDDIDPDNPEYIRLLMRPAEIKEDVKLMEQRKRVSNILHSDVFCKELNDIIRSQLKTGLHSSSLLALQQISDLFLPQSNYGSTPSSSKKTGATSRIAINDFRGAEFGLYSKGERLLRCKLASVYRLVDLFGYNTGIHNHITVRISRDHEHFLINPFGIMYHEISASSLIKVDMKGEMIDQGTTTLTVDKTGWMMHSAIYAARSDIRCIIHLNTPAALAVSCMKTNLLPLCTSAMVIGQVSTYTPAQNSDPENHCDDRQAIANAFGPTNKVMLVRNYGLLACGETVEEAWFYATKTLDACETQLRLTSVGIDHLNLPSDEVCQRVRESALQQSIGQITESAHQWKLGELEFEALMRHLDNAGYRTGYFYHQASVRQEKVVKKHEDVEIPPTTTSFAQMYDDEAEYAKAQKLFAEKQKSLQRTHWLPTPNVYHREDIEEINTCNPKKITRWVPSKSEDVRLHPTSGVSVPVTNPNAFAPQGDNPKELKQQQQRIRAKYYKDLNSAGPTSKLLDGVTYDEARRMREEGMAKRQGDQSVVVGAASKGIIQRDHRHNAVVYNTMLSANPFDKITDQELQRYHEEVARKNRDYPFSDTEADDTFRNTADVPADNEGYASAPPSTSAHKIERVESARAAEAAAKAIRTEMAARSQSMRYPTGTLSPEPMAGTLRSDTSGAEASHDDTEKEIQDASTSKDKKKKKRFKMPSFARKNKDKESKHK